MLVAFTVVPAVVEPQVMVVALQTKSLAGAAGGAPTQQTLRVLKAVLAPHAALVCV